MKKNTKIIRLTENDLERMVRRIIKESDDETSTPIKPITIHGKTYNFVEDLPTRELGIGSYVVDNDKGIVLVNGDTPLQDWLTQDMDTNEDYMDDNSNSLLLQKIKSLNPMKSKSKSSRIKYYNNNVELVAVKDKNVLTISGYYFLSDLGWRPTNWSISRPLDQEMLESFKALWNQHMSPVEIVRIFDYKPEELKGALLTKPDLDKTSDDLGQIFGEDYMSSEEDLINAAYDLMYDLTDEDVEILDLQDAANILDEELYEGNHGPIMDQRIEDLLTQIYEIIGYPDYDEGEDIEDHL